MRSLASRIDPPFWVLALVLLILFGPILIGARVIFWGLPLLQFFPWHEFAKQTVLSGHLPLWNPWLGMGAPLLANAQSALLYPPNWLLLIVPVDFGQGVLLAAHLLLAGYGMARLSRALGIGRLGQTVAGLAFMLSGYLVARSWFLTINASVAWLPWIILAGEKARKQERGIFSAPLAVLLCLQWLAGHWQTAWYTWLILALWMTVRACAASPAWKSVLAAWLRLISSSLLAFGLGAIQFLPTIEYWLQSQRSGGADPSSALTYSFWPWRLITLLAPNFFGNPAQGDYWGYANFWEDAVYIGLLPLGLAAAAAAARLRRKALEGFPYGLLLALLPLTLILGLGKWTPVFPFLFDHVPTFNLFQAPTRIMIGFVFSLCLLAGAGAELWARTEGASGRWAANLGVVSGAAVLAGIGAGSMRGIQPSFSHSIILAGVIGVFIAALLLLKIFSRGRPRLKRIGPAAVVVLLAADLILADSGLLPTTSPQLYRAANPTAAELAANLNGRRILMPEDIRYSLMYDRAFTFRAFAGIADWMDVRRWELPNVGMLDGIPSANNFDSFVPSRYAILIEGLEDLPQPQRDRLLKMMDVGAVWEWPEGADSPSLRYLPGGAVRAWGVCRAVWAIGPDSAWQMLTDPQFDPSTTVILEAGRGEEGNPCRETPAVALTDLSDPNVVRAEVDFSQDGFLVLADVNAGGWEAFLDGERVPLLQADYAFRAVRIPAGTHTVEFRYAPLSFWAGFLLSGLIIAGWIVAGLIIAVRRMRLGVRRNKPV